MRLPCPNLAVPFCLTLSFIVAIFFHFHTVRYTSIPRAWTRMLRKLDINLLRVGLRKGIIHLNSQCKFELIKNSAWASCISCIPYTDSAWIMGKVFNDSIVLRYRSHRKCLKKECIKTNHSKKNINIDIHFLFC